MAPVSRQCFAASDAFAILFIIIGPQCRANVKGKQNIQQRVNAGHTGKEAHSKFFQAAAQAFRSKLKCVGSHMHRSAKPSDNDPSPSPHDSAKHPQLTPVAEPPQQHMRYSASPEPS